MAEQTTLSSKLWSEIVEGMDPSPEDKTGYIFSNGKKFIASSDAD
jgi:hypothetical protein